MTPEKIRGTFWRVSFIFKEKNVKSFMHQFMKSGMVQGSEKREGAALKKNIERVKMYNVLNLKLTNVLKKLREEDLAHGS